MMGLFLWVLVFLLASLESVAEDQNVESCCSFKNGTMHETLTKGQQIVFTIYGRENSTGDRKILRGAVKKRKGDYETFELREQDSNRTTTGSCFSLQLKAELDHYETESPEHYPLRLTVDSPWEISLTADSPSEIKYLLKTERDKSNIIKLPSKDLYINFTGTVGVEWAVVCKPGREEPSASVPENACSLYQDVCTGLLVVVVILAIILLVTARLLHRLWNPEAITSPPPRTVGACVPRHEDPVTDAFGYIDLRAVDQHFEEERYQVTNGLVNQPRSPAANINNSAFDYATEFQVRAGDDTRRKLSVDGGVRLVVETDVLLITLISTEGQRIARWTLEQIRRFGSSDKEFHFEAGRKSAHGEGLFNFITSQGKQIHDLLEQQVDSRLDREATGCQAHTHDDGYEIPLKFSDKNDGYEIPMTFSNNDDDYQNSLTSDEHTYEEIPGITNNRV